MSSLSEKTKSGKEELLPQEKLLSDEMELRCPECAFDHGHITGVTTSINEYHTLDGVILLIEGECGHLWNLAIRPNKGRIGLEARLI